MAYDETKDQLLHTWENEQTGLILALYRYGEGEPKLQIGPRSYSRKDGSKGTTKAGRLAVDDVLWLSETLEEVKAHMQDHLLDAG
jgi:hypothetical protein